MKYSERVEESERAFLRQMVVKYGPDSPEARGEVVHGEDMDLKDYTYPQDGDTFGPWRFQQSNLTLQLEGKHIGWGRELDLEKINSSKDVVDWLSHYGNKVWGNAKVMGHMWKALQALAGPGNLAFGPSITKRIQERYGTK